MPSYEENEARRLDLAEKELDMKREMVERELQLREREAALGQERFEAQEQEREKKHREDLAYREMVERSQDRHGELLERVAVALEAMAGARI